MNIWRILVLSCLTVLVLSSCAISIDEPNPQAEPGGEQAGTEQDKRQDEQQTENEEKTSRNVFTQIFEHFFEPTPEDLRQIDDESAKQLNYLALGDSLTAGVGDEYNQDGFVGRLTDSLTAWPSISDVEVDNRGKRGRRSDQLLKLVEKGHYDEELQEAQLISITMGGNDVMKIVRKDLLNLKRDAFDKELLAFKERYSKIISGIREKNPTVPLILIGFYNPFSIVTNEANEFETIIKEWNKVIEDIANEDVNACYVSVEDLFDSNKELVYHTDFFHPNAKGYEKMTERILEAMEKCSMEQKINKEIGFEE
ncbi:MULTISPECIES: GDSL-type esterase/lipase family protein [unclassified Lysinibacillus]|uniref:GDSL-type esterase/lipase family protein n=1 Tax=unclassified Lysinibacillus TaxID=2636778 RepID=UPI002557B56F|nr:MULTISPECIES: GDSL-type esterase/lipase family protein [unclassified Lysinibacillus]MDM5248249.1 GDSL-type esterase/lipase family protein [Lysinibacillus sp. G4S2]